MKRRRPCIGVFDSGFGGLTVLKSLLEKIPEADYIYFGDTARLPYGSKSADTVAKYAVEAAHFLEERWAQLLVIACNTATALALDKITRACTVPVIGVIVPGAEQASEATQKKKVVVIGTEATVNSHAYHAALTSRGIAAREKACPLFVPLVEEGWTESDVTRQVAEIYLSDAFSGDFSTADVLLLGCTHYPLIKPILQQVAPAHVHIVDSAESTASTAHRWVHENFSRAEEPAERREQPRLKFFATDSVDKFRLLGARFLGRPIDNVELVELAE